MSQDFSFPQSENLKKADEFKTVLKLGQKKKFPGFTIYILQNHLGLSRLGMIIGKKVGCAPKRKRIKRVWREAFRLERACFPQTVDMVIRVYPNCEDPIFTECRDRLHGLAAFQ